MGLPLVAAVLPVEDTRDKTRGQAGGCALASKADRHLCRARCPKLASRMRQSCAHPVPTVKLRYRRTDHRERKEVTILKFDKLVDVLSRQYDQQDLENRTLTMYDLKKIGAISSVKEGGVKLLGPVRSRSAL